MLKNKAIKDLAPSLVEGSIEFPKFDCIEEVTCWVTDKMMEKFKLEEPEQINRGYCFIWAYLVRQID